MKSRRAFLSQLALGSDKLVHKPGESTFVCIFLRGGADTLNMFVPYGDDSYYKARPTIAVPPPQKNNGKAETSIKLDSFYALHPKLAPLYASFAEGRLAIIQAVGSDNESGSHFDAQDQMEHGQGLGRAANGGWLGRYLTARTKADMTPLCAVAIGATMPESLRGAPAATAMTSIDDLQLRLPASDAACVTAALAQLYTDRLDILSHAGQDTLDVLKRLHDLPQQSKPFSVGAHFPDTGFGHGLAQVARLVKAEVGLEVACLDLDGWDTHFVQGSTTGLQADRMDELASGLAAFDTELGKHRDHVTTLVMTEFGRRIYENVSLGTDHGRGFAMLALGAGVRGGKVYGNWPGLSDNGDFQLGPSGLGIVYDYRSVLAELAGRTTRGDQLKQIFPQFSPQRIGFIEC